LLRSLANEVCAMTHAALAALPHISAIVLAFVDNVARGCTAQAET
jgi:hypothetical protein